MIRAFNGKEPKIADSAFISEWAYVVGDVEIGEGSGVWPGAVIRADFGKIRIGKNCQVEDNSVLHSGTDMEIGDNVMIGHSAVVHGLRIGNNVLIGNNATILDGAEVGDRCIVGANAMVAAGQVIPSDSFAVGVPARLKQEASAEGMEAMRRRMARRFAEAAAEGLPGFSYADLARKYKEAGL